MINITKKLDETINSWLDTKLSELNEVSPGIFIGGVKDQASKFPIWLFEYNNNLYIASIIIARINLMDLTIYIPLHLFNINCNPIYVSY